MKNKMKKTYINGNVEERGDMTRARELLVRAGIYRTMGNFGPYLLDKEDRIFKKIKTFIIEDIEFTIIEAEVMSFSASKPYTHQEAWFQTVNKNVNNF